MKLWDVIIEVSQIGDKVVDYKFKTVVTGDDRDCAEAEALKYTSEKLADLGEDVKDGISAVIKDMRVSGVTEYKNPRYPKQSRTTFEIIDEEKEAKAKDRGVIHVSESGYIKNGRFYFSNDFIRGARLKDIELHYDVTHDVTGGSGAKFKYVDLELVYLIRDNQEVRTQIARQSHQTAEELLGKVNYYIHVIEDNKYILNWVWWKNLYKED